MLAHPILMPSPTAKANGLIIVLSANAAGRHRVPTGVSYLYMVFVNLGEGLFLLGVYSSSGRRCPDVSAKWMPVLRHSACCCHRTKRRPYVTCVMYFSHICLGFPLFLFPATIPCVIVFSKPLCGVTRQKYLDPPLNCWRQTKSYSQGN